MTSINSIMSLRSIRLTSIWPWPDPILSPCTGSKNHSGCIRGASACTWSRMGMWATRLCWWNSSRPMCRQVSRACCIWFASQDGLPTSNRPCSSRGSITRTRRPIHGRRTTQGTMVARRSRRGGGLRSEWLSAINFIEVLFFTVVGVVFPQFSRCILKAYSV